MRTFQFRGATYVVKRGVTMAKGDPSPQPTIVYRDARDLGGPWLLADRDIADNSAHPTFRRYLRKAKQQIEEEENAAATSPDGSDRSVQPDAERSAGSGDS